MDAFAEINEAGNRIEVHFQYDPAAVKAVKAVPGARFFPPNKGGPMWQLPLDLTSARQLREQFGDDLLLGDALKEWGKKATVKEAELTRLSVENDADLPVLKKKLPKLYKWLRPYQRADVAFLARADAINSNQPGLGKTAEVIGAVFEAKMDKGPQLIIAPKTSLMVVWHEELTRWQKHPVLVTSGDDSKDRRQEVIDEAFELAGQDKPFWLVLNPNMVRYERDREAEMVVENGKKQYPLIPVYGELFNIPWKTKVVDEYHKMGVTNPKSLMYKAVTDIPSEKTILMSGTPMGGKPIKLWSALHIIDPAKFTSKWRWADQWLTVEDGYEGHKIIHGIRDERMEAFNREHAPYLLRRTKAEVLTELPPKQHQVILCPMTATQRKQYDSISAEAEIKIEEEHLSITGILAEYTRLKQFADAKQKVKHMADGSLKVLPTDDSGKLPFLMQLLADRGITGDSEEEGDEKVVVFSQFSGIVDMLEEFLNEQGIATAKITGSVNRKGERTRLVDEFQEDGGARVMLMTTGAGGVSITLDRASTVIFMDETWDPDDQEQGEDRVHRASRIHQVMVYYLRSERSIEQYIAEVTKGKRLTNDQVLDLHRMLKQQELAVTA